MSVNLEQVLKNIQTEKDTKLTANNLRYGVTCMGVQGGLHPVTIQGSDDIGRAIYLQDTTPEDPNGIWINTDKTYDDIYIENERYATDGSIVFSNADTTDPSNPIASHTNNGNLNLMGATYAQKNNIVHFFGYHSTNASAETTTATQRHWKYDFDTNTWTRLSDCPTPQGGVKAAWIGDYIYIFGTAYCVNTDYANYAYKYDVVNDTWTRLNNSPIAPNRNSYGISCVYDNDDAIYLVSMSYHYKYIISTDQYIALSYNSDVSGYNNVVYYDNNLYAMPYTTGGNRTCKKYNISTNTWSTYGTVSNWFPTSSYVGATVLVNNRMYSFVGTNGQITSSVAAISSDYGWVRLDSSSNYKKITTRNAFSSTTSIIGVPVCVFETNRGSIILFFGGISSGQSIAISNQMGVVTQDKNYNTLENDSLIIYSTDGTMGTYITGLYLDEKIINGKIYQRFNDVNFWDATNNVLIKNLSTYYGNGTNWVQIK